MSYVDKLDEEIDDLTNKIMDEIRDILLKHEEHFPDWCDEDLPYNLDDKIYGDIYNEIRYYLYKQKGINKCKYT